MEANPLRTAIELIGIFGILVSLIFVGLEIRDSNIQARAAAYQSIGIATSEFHQNFDTRTNLLADEIFDGDRLALWSYTDWLTLERLLIADLRLFETVLLQVDQGLLDESAIANLGYSFQGDGYLNIPAIACLWPRLSQGTAKVGPLARLWIENGSPESGRATCPIDLGSKQQSFKREIPQ